jgi:hypothetical protein
LVLPKIEISILGAKMVGNPDTPSISPDTLDLEHSRKSSGYRPGNYRLGSLDTPGINPDTLEIPDVPD